MADHLFDSVRYAEQIGEISARTKVQWKKRLTKAFPAISDPWLNSILSACSLGQRSSVDGRSSDNEENAISTYAVLPQQR